MCISDFFILGKLTECHHFVTYLWNDPRIYDQDKYSVVLVSTSAVTKDLNSWLNDDVLRV